MTMNQSSAYAPNRARTREHQRRARTASENKPQRTELHRIHYCENDDPGRRSDTEAQQSSIVEVFDGVRQRDKYEKARRRYQGISQRDAFLRSVA